MLSLNFLINSNAMLKLSLLKSYFLSMNSEFFNVSLFFTYFVIVILCPPPLFHSSNIPVPFQTSLTSLQYGFCRDYVGFFPYRDSSICSTPFLPPLFHLTREKRDLIPRTLEPSTCSKSKSKSKKAKRSYYNGVC